MNLPKDINRKEKSLMIHTNINNFFSPEIKKIIDFNVVPMVVSYEARNDALIFSHGKSIDYISEALINEIRYSLDDRDFKGVTHVHINKCDMTMTTRFTVRYYVTQSLKEKTKELRLAMGDKLFNMLNSSCELNLDNINVKIDLFNTMKKEKETFKKVYGNDYKIKVIEKITRRRSATELMHSIAPMYNDFNLCIKTREEEIIDTILSYKNNVYVNKDFIIKSLIDGNDIIYNKGDMLIIKLTEKNKKIMSSKWCITNSNHYWKYYNEDSGNEQYICYDFKDKVYIGFNYDGKEISNAFDWNNKNYNKKILNYLLTNISFM